MQIFLFIHVCIDGIGLDGHCRIHVSELLSIGDDDVTLRTAAGCRADTTTNFS